MMELLKFEGICYGKYGIIDNPETFCMIVTESDSLFFVQENVENPARFGIILVSCSPASESSRFMHEIFVHARFFFVHAPKFCAHTQILCVHINFLHTIKY